MSVAEQTLSACLAAGHHHPPAALTHTHAPSDYTAAMQTQAAVALALGASVGGWKVAVRPDGVAVAAPLFRSLITGQTDFPIHPVGLMGIEVEIGLRLKRDLPARPMTAYRRDDILAATQALFIGIEIVSTRLPDHANAPFPLVLADNLANGGYVMGAEITDWSGLDLSGLMTSVVIDGRMVYEKPGGHGSGDPLVPVVAYASAQIDCLGGLRRGQIITTGTLCGLLPVGPHSQVEATIEGIGKAHLKLSPKF